MRRGHSGIGGWRSEYPRFRPRNAGHHQHRESKPFEGARFPPTGSRPYKPAQSFFPYQGHNANQFSEHRERNQFRPENRTYTPNRYQERGPSSSHRPSFSAPQHRHDIRNKSPYKERHYNDLGEYASKRDIDYRQVYQASHTPNPCNRPQPWAVDQRRPSYNENNPQETHNQDIGDSNMSSFHSAHRPPSSDHYSSNFIPLAEHSSSFKHSFDDTVKIVRNRILNRSEGQQPMMEPQSNQINNLNDKNIIPVTTTQQTETPAKKKLQRRGPNIKTNNNCNQMKNNILQQLFKMDKNNIHKLIDNPSSSSKFEYALNSLVEESQNSLNRQQRSIAEKSLCHSSTQFINSDNNTIYEDTFMKQMQGCLDPQDTVFLEDIKPIVMAELTKVLQLDEYFPDVKFSSTNHSQTNYFQDNEIYFNEDLNKDVTYSKDDYSKYDVRSIEDVVESFDYNGTKDYEENKPIFERRPLKRTCDYSEKKRLSSESRRQSGMIETQSNEPVFESSNVPPYFTVDINSDEDETFAELDKQYHVPVDHNFIKFDDPTELETISVSSSKSPSALENISVSSSKSPSAKTQSIYQNNDVFVNEINNENINSNTNLPASSDIRIKEALLEDLEDSVGFSPEKPINNNDYKDVLIQNSVKVTINSDCKTYESEKSDKSKSNKSVVPSNARKRSTDERSSHRKEKRRKSDTSPSHLKDKSNKEKHLDDTTVQSSEKCKTPLASHTKNISDKEHSKSHVKINEKEYSDKYVKRKDSHETKDKHLKSRRISESNASNHSIVSPKSVKNTNSQSCSNNKADVKNKLKTIDMFMEKPRKATVHQALRNTASALKDGSKNSEMKLPKLLLTLKKDKVSQEYNAISEVTKATKESQTDLSKISTSRFCQTDVKKMFEIAVQTDPVSFEKTVSKTKNALERMKEIDMEIQVLLQEKFKLYTTSESKTSSLSNMPSLGMTVFNVAPMIETKETDSSETTSLLEEHFTDMPFEEIGDIAFDVIQESSPSLGAKRNRRQTKKMQSHSPSTTSRRSVKKAKTPNISLIEKIISDDKPIEDIISLDELERSPIKTRNKTKTGVKKMKITKTKRNIHKKKKNTQATAKEAKLSRACKMRECSVVLERIDLDTLFKHEIIHPVVPMDSTVFLEQTERESQNIKVEIGETKEILNETSFTSAMQIDMLDVSEDIIIGESCEVKMIEEKDSDCRDLTASSDEIILDNSQSSENVVSVIDGPSKECKTYDYLLDEGLKRDSVTVLANGDAVLAIEFLEDGFLAACLDGNVYNFNSKGQLLSTLRASNFAVTCLNIAKDKYGTTVYTGSLDSRVRYYDLENGLQKGPESNVLHSVQAMDRAWDTLFVGTRKGYVFTFECKNNQVIPVTSARFSENSILAIRALKEGPRKVLLVAARTENVTVKDAQTGLLLRTLEGPKMTVYSLLYEDGKVFCGTSGHQIQIFDYSSGAHVSSHEGGKGVVCLRSVGGLLFAGCYDGCVYVYSQGERTPIAQLRGPNHMLLSLAVKGDKIIVGYQNKGFYIWKIPSTVLQEMVL